MEDASKLALANVVKLIRSSEKKFKQGNFKAAIDEKRKANLILKFQSINEEIIDKFKKEYIDYNVITIDGIKIERKNSWFHIRKSNTEPVVRIYAEATSLQKAELLANEVIKKIKKI